jgi:hypothetical protein
MPKLSVHGRTCHMSKKGRKPLEMTDQARGLENSMFRVHPLNRGLRRACVLNLPTLLIGAGR